MLPSSHSIHSRSKKLQSWRNKRPTDSLQVRRRHEQTKKLLYVQSDATLISTLPVHVLMLPFPLSLLASNARRWRGKERRTPGRRPTRLHARMPTLFKHLKPVPSPSRDPSHPEGIRALITVLRSTTASSLTHLVQRTRQRRHHTVSDQAYINLMDTASVRRCLTISKCHSSRSAPRRSMACKLRSVDSIAAV
jgi:hypothetical protein